MVAVIAELPSPASGRSAPSSRRTRQPISADRMGAPIRIYREPRRRRHEGAAECPRKNRGWKDAWQCPIEAGERLTISFCLLGLPIGHLRPPVPTAWCHQAVKPSSPKGNRLYAPATEPSASWTGEPNRTEASPLNRRSDHTQRLVMPGGVQLMR